MFVNLICFYEPIGETQISVGVSHQNNENNHNKAIIRRDSAFLSTCKVCEKPVKERTKKPGKRVK